MYAFKPLYSGSSYPSIFIYFQGERKRKAREVGEDRREFVPRERRLLHPSSLRAQLGRVPPRPPPLLRLHQQLRQLLRLRLDRRQVSRLHFAT